MKAIYYYPHAGENPNSPGSQIHIPVRARLKQIAEQEPGGLMACSPDIFRELKEAAKIDVAVATKLHLAGVELDREILVRWGLVENYKPKMDFCGTCGNLHVAGEIYNHNFVRRDLDGGVEKQGAAGKDRRDYEADSDGDDGAKSPAVGVGKPEVNMDLLRAIAAGKIPKEVSASVDYLSQEIEVDLCGFKSYNDVDGENYICGKEKHGPKIKHGEWVKV